MATVRAGGAGRATGQDGVHAEAIGALPEALRPALLEALTLLAGGAGRAAGRSERPDSLAGHERVRTEKRRTAHPASPQLREEG